METAPYQPYLIKECTCKPGVKEVADMCQNCQDDYKDWIDTMNIIGYEEDED